MTEPESDQFSQPRPRLRPRVSRQLAVLILVACAVVSWRVPSNVAALIAQQQDVLLNRYSTGRFAILLIWTLVLLGIAWQIAFPSKLRVRERCFRAGTFAAALVLCLLAVDLAWRDLRAERYIEQTIGTPPAATTGASLATSAPSPVAKVRHRPPFEKITFRYVDQPKAARSYPNRPPGYPDQQITLSTDACGFRNPLALDRADIVALGDSFTEGENVDDAQTWPRLLAQQTGMSTYNLGMSGTSPWYYLNAFKFAGARLSPKTVVCMIYGGNDFRPEPLLHPRHRPNSYLETSPLWLAAQRSLIGLLGSVAADGPVPDVETVSWMPIAVPEGPQARYYTFTSKHMIWLWHSRQELLASPGWLDASAPLAELRALCTAQRIRPIVVYAPPPPQVVLPLIGERVDSDMLRRFALYSIAELPPAEQFRTLQLAHLDAREDALADFCLAQGLEFVSLTRPLREAMASSTQVYFTYDQHFTPLGQMLAAYEIRRQIAADEAGINSRAGVAAEPHSPGTVRTGS